MLCSDTYLYKTTLPKKKSVNLKQEEKILISIFFQKTKTVILIFFKWNLQS